MSETYEVTKTRCVVSGRNGSLDHCEMDTIFIDQIPHVVFEWEPQPDGSRKPIRLVRLDPKHFHSMSQSGGNHIYERPIEEP